MLTPIITDYKILKLDELEDLEKEVTAFIKEGWQPLGGVSVCLHATSDNYESDKEYSQSIVKYEHKNPNSI